jgi:hypothetical protein
MNKKMVKIQEGCRKKLVCFWRQTPLPCKLAESVTYEYEQYLHAPDCLMPYLL